METIQAFASGRELVLWCAKCQHVIARLGGMHPVTYVVQLTTDHNCEKSKSDA